MNQVELLIGIVERDLTPEYEKRMEQAAVHVLVSTPARGTAKVEMLHYLGQERTEKTALFGVVTPATGRTLVRQFQHDRCFRRGSCVWAAVPISSVGGATALEFMSEKQEKSEVGAVEKTPFDLIVVLANYGANELVMDAARSAGAKGGTVIHAKGTGVGFAEKFFGVTLSVEKEVILIITNAEQKHEIMRAIMEKAGLSSKAHSVVFSLPVSQVSGIMALEET